MFSLNPSVYHAIQTILCLIICINMLIVLPMPDNIVTKHVDKISAILFIVMISAVKNFCKSKAVSHDDPTEQSGETAKS